MTSGLSSACHHRSEAADLRVHIHMEAEELPNKPMQVARPSPTADRHTGVQKCACASLLRSASMRSRNDPIGSSWLG